MKLATFQVFYQHTPSAFWGGDAESPHSAKCLLCSSSEPCTGSPRDCDKGLGIGARDFRLFAG